MIDPTSRRADINECVMSAKEANDFLMLLLIRQITNDKTPIDALKLEKLREYKRRNPVTISIEDGDYDDENEEHRLTKSQLGISR
jgi:hypothetical protein